jgi:hypothetical protein
MPVPELMKDAALLVEDAVVGVDQPKKFIALEKSGARAPKAVIRMPPTNIWK